MKLPTLSPNIDLEQTRKQAKDLLRAFKSGDSAVLDRIRWNHPRFRGLTDQQIREGRFILADAQLVIAKLHYFPSWPKLLAHIETLRKQDPEVLRFERAADAIIGGDVDTLRDLLDRQKDLVHQRSTRGHRSTLMHYVAANGVEDYRQITPHNILNVARVLLDAGADVNAESEAYGGGSMVLALTATSAHPRRAGVQIPLIDLLLEHGAIVNASIGRDALANGCPEAARALVDRGASVETVIVAAGTEKLDLVKKLATHASKDQIHQALIMAAAYGTLAIVEYLLDRGADVTASDGMTALHNACGRADLEIIQLLISRGAPLEKENMFGGTVLDSTLWFAYNTDPRDMSNRDYAAVLDLLIAAGARTDVYPEMQEYIDEVYRRGRRGK